MRASPPVPNPVARARGGLAEAEQVVKADEAEPERFGHSGKKRPRLKDGDQPAYMPQGDAGV
jgi:hypothetical protein